MQVVAYAVQPVQLRRRSHGVVKVGDLAQALAACLYIKHPNLARHPLQLLHTKHLKGIACESTAGA